MQNKRPNILWVSFEDTQPYYGCYGNRVASTPNVDRLAAEGRRYTRAFSTAGVCAPARSAIITGMYAISIGTMHMRTTHTHPDTPEMPTPYAAVVPHYVKCFPEYLRAAGYYCTNNDKTDYQFDAPLTAWDELGPDAHWHNRPDPDQPFFAVFNPTRSHESGMWPEKTPEITVDPADVTVPPYFPDTPKVREAIARMHTNITHVDTYLGELLDQLEKDGLVENTIVMHWSDHGPLPRGKRWLYDAGVRVPLIVRWPGRIAPGELDEELVSTIDLGPTVLSIAGVPVPAHMQGRAFLGEQSAPRREYVFGARDRFDEAYDMVRMARDRKFKYIRNCRPELPYLLWIPYRNRHPILQEMWRVYRENGLTEAQAVMFADRRPVEELYDTEADPYEMHNLASDPEFAEHKVRLARELDGWLDEVGDMGKIDESVMVRNWYPDGERPRTARPVFIAIAENADGQEPAAYGGAYVGPAVLQLHCATQGASIAYRVEPVPGAAEPGPTPPRAENWALYTGPIRLPGGQTRIRARAVRIGYFESEERTAVFEVTAGR